MTYADYSDAATLLIVILSLVIVPGALLSFAATRLRIGLCMFVLLAGAAASYVAYVAKVHGAGLMYFFIACGIVLVTALIALSRLVIAFGQR